MFINKRGKTVFDLKKKIKTKKNNKSSLDIKKLLLLQSEKLLSTLQINRKFICGIKKND